MKDSLAKEILIQIKKDNKRANILFFIMWIVTFIALIIMSVLYIKLQSDIGVVETTTTQEVQQENTNGNNNFIGRDGDINGKANN